MAEDNILLSTIYATWHEYHEHISQAVAPLSAEQLALRAAPHLRSIGENAAHIIGCRAGWYTLTMGEVSDADIRAYAEWDTPGAAPRIAAELVQALDRTWQLMADCLARWSPADMQHIFLDDWSGTQVELTRAWIVWHVIEHDLHHGGELSLTLGIHGLPAQFPS